MSGNGYGQGVQDQGTGRANRAFETYIERQNYQKGRNGQ